MQLIKNKQWVKNRELSEEALIWSFLFIQLFYETIGCKGESYDIQNHFSSIIMRLAFFIFRSFFSLLQSFLCWWYYSILLSVIIFVFIWYFNWAILKGRGEGGGWGSEKIWKRGMPIWERLPIEGEEFKPSAHNTSDLWQQLDTGLGQEAAPWFQCWNTSTSFVWLAW